jgi:hypothetical protein
MSTINDLATHAAPGAPLDLKSTRSCAPAQTRRVASDPHGPTAGPRAWRRCGCRECAEALAVGQSVRAGCKLLDPKREHTPAELAELAANEVELWRRWPPRALDRPQSPPRPPLAYRLRSFGSRAARAAAAICSTPGARRRSTRRRQRSARSSSRSASDGGSDGDHALNAATRLSVTSSRVTRTARPTYGVALYLHSSTTRAPRHSQAVPDQFRPIAPLASPAVEPRPVGAHLASSRPHRADQIGGLHHARTPEGITQADPCGANAGGCAPRSLAGSNPAAQGSQTQLTDRRPHRVAQIGTRMSCPARVCDLVSGGTGGAEINHG